MLLEAFTTYLSIDGAPRIEGLSPVFLNLRHVVTFAPIGDGWTELRTVNYGSFYMPLPPDRVKADIEARGWSPILGPVGG